MHRTPCDSTGHVLKKWVPPCKSIVLGKLASKPAREPLRKQENLLNPCLGLGWKKWRWKVGIDTNSRNFLEGRTWVSACGAQDQAYCACHLLTRVACPCGLPPSHGELGQHRLCCWMGLEQPWDFSLLPGLFVVWCLSFPQLKSLFLYTSRVRTLKNPHFRGKPTKRHLSYHGWVTDHGVVTRLQVWESCVPTHSYRAFSCKHVGLAHAHVSSLSSQTGRSRAHAHVT